MQSWIDELHKLGPENLTMAITGTKCDKVNEREVTNTTHANYLSLLAPSQVTLQQGQEFADKVDAIFLETSSLTGKNIDQLFTQLG